MLPLNVIPSGLCCSKHRASASCQTVGRGTNEVDSTIVALEALMMVLDDGWLLLSTKTARSLLVTLSRLCSSNRSFQTWKARHGYSAP